MLLVGRSKSSCQDRLGADVNHVLREWMLMSSYTFLAFWSEWWFTTAQLVGGRSPCFSDALEISNALVVPYEVIDLSALGNVDIDGAHLSIQAARCLGS